MFNKLQIISGEFRGKKLLLPPFAKATGGKPLARPTQARARLGVMNILAGLDVPPGATFWDAFAGSGAFGAEFLSRFPDSRAIFTDINPATAAANTKIFGARARIVQGDAISQIPKFATDADIVFIDPPFADAALGAKFLEKFMAAARPGAIAILEYDPSLAEGSQSAKRDAGEGQKCTDRNYNPPPAAKIAADPSAREGLITTRKYGRAWFSFYRKT
ncbi:MAG: RsmD family RNA methyltransferase [Rickettsiales bacterium]|jgi:16S rRNA G966 N2-methylase RsmD|nr:RsmD family RNA methyltransferase [Rickettsiales bacterium]